MAMELQKKYCEDKGLPFFAPSSGICWGCNKTVRDSNTEHITGHSDGCHRTFCD